jgi:hypothetical protein
MESLLGTLERAIPGVKRSDDAELLHVFSPVDTPHVRLTAHQRQNFWAILDRVHSEFGRIHGNLCARCLHVSNDGQRVAITGWCSPQTPSFEDMEQEKDTLLSLLTSSSSASNEPRNEDLQRPPTSVDASSYNAWVQSATDIIQPMQEKMAELCSLEGNYLAPFFPSLRIFRQWVRQYFIVTLWLEQGVCPPKDSYPYSTLSNLLLEEYFRKPLRHWQECATYRLMLGVMQAHTQWPSMQPKQLLKACIMGDYDADSESLVVHEDPSLSSVLDEFAPMSQRRIEKEVNRIIRFLNENRRELLQYVRSPSRRIQEREALTWITGYSKTVRKQMPAVEKYICFLERFEVDARPYKVPQQPLNPPGAFGTGFERRPANEYEPKNPKANQPGPNDTRRQPYGTDTSGHRTEWYTKRRPAPGYRLGSGGKANPVDPGFSFSTRPGVRGFRPGSGSSFSSSSSSSSSLGSNSGSYTFGTRRSFGSGAGGPASSQNRKGWQHRRTHSRPFEDSSSSSSSRPGSSSRSFPKNKPNGLPTEQENAYRALDLDPNDLYDCNTIKRRYKTLSLQYHPVSAPFLLSW